MKFFKHSVAFVFSFFIVVSAVFAQGQQMQMQKQSQADSITDAELQKFVNVTQEVQKIQQESQQKVQGMLAEKEMDMRRFQTIMMSKRNPKMADSVNVSEKEQKTIKELQPKLMKMQQDSRKKMMGVMQDEGLKPKRFQAIMRAVQSNPQVMKRFQKIAQDSAQKK